MLIFRWKLKYLGYILTAGDEYEPGVVYIVKEKECAKFKGAQLKAILS